MEKLYEITEKQLVFLEGFLLRKYPTISEEKRIELVDHLILDFEATTENGNLSQYLSNELEFIKKFVFNGVSALKISYRKETWKQFFRFFIDFKLIPYSLLVVIVFYFFAEILNDKWLWFSLVISQAIVMSASLLFGMINKKKLKKLEEVKLLGSEIWLPFLMVQLPLSFDFQHYITSNNYLFIVYTLFTINYAVAAFIVLRKHRKIILEKYKHLLN